MKSLPAFVAGALLLAAPAAVNAADLSAGGPRPTPTPRPTVDPVPVHSVYAGRYVFAAVDLRGDNRTAGVGHIAVARDSTFKGYIRNHETGKVARLAGRVMRNGKLEFIPDFENVRHDVRILRRAACIYGLHGRYIISHDPPPPVGDPLTLADEVPEPGDGGDTGAEEVDLTEVIRTAGVVIGHRR